MDEIRATSEQRQVEQERKRERIIEEDRQFRQRLLAELERHNAVLERILARLDKG